MFSDYNGILLKVNDREISGKISRNIKQINNFSIMHRLKKVLKRKLENILLNESEDGIKNAKHFVLSENKKYQYEKIL